MRRFGFTLVTLVLIAAAAWLVLFRWPLHNPHPPLRLAQGTLAVRDVTVYTTPDAAPLTHVDLLVRDGRIASIAPGLALPQGTRVLACTQCVVTAGFWNTHVHFTQPRWAFAAYRSQAELNVGLSDMLTSRGFTTVVDLGSNPLDTISLRRRIETGDLLGPFVYTAGPALYPPNGLPFYLREHQPWLLQKLASEPSTPAAAESAVRGNLRRGSDVLKLFTGSYVQRGTVEPMPLAVAQAAAAQAHRQGQIVFAHPSDLAGVTVARDAGVDVLAHAADTTEGITPQLLESLVAHRMAMVPTLKMFATTVTTKPAYLDPIYDEVRAFHALGGELMFGTDVGYMTDYTTQGEFEALARSGLDYRDMLRMLTTTPAMRMGVEHEKGMVAPGMLADFVLLGSDPATHIAAFSDVRVTVRSGRVLYQRDAQPGTRTGAQ